MFMASLRIRFPLSIGCSQHFFASFDSPLTPTSMCCGYLSLLRSSLSADRKWYNECCAKHCIKKWSIEIFRFPVMHLGMTLFIHKVMHTDTLIINLFDHDSWVTAVQLIFLSDFCATDNTFLSWMFTSLKKTYSNAKSNRDEIVISNLMYPWYWKTTRYIRVVCHSDPDATIMIMRDNMQSFR